MYRFDFEWEILEFFHKICCDFLTFFFRIITEFGAGELAIIVLLIVYYVYNKEIGKKIAYITINSMLINSSLKSLFLAKRPFQYEGKEYLRVLEASQDKATGTSFPSGHSQNSGSLYGALFKIFKNKIIRVLSLILIILVPISRLYLGVHFPGDVVIGCILGIGFAVLGNYLVDLFKRKNYSLYYLYIISLVIFLPFVIINLNKGQNSDLFKTYGLFIGFVLGSLFEEKKVNFNNDVPILNKILRIVIGGACLLLIKAGLKAVFNMFDFIPSNLLDLIRYFCISIFGIGLFPWIFKNIENRGKKNEK